MSKRAQTRNAFLSAIVLLCLCILATYISFSYFKEGVRLVTHTQEVRGTLGDVESVVTDTARARMVYLVSGDPAALDEYRTADSKLQERLRHLRELVKDNPTQVQNSDQLQTRLAERRAFWEESIAAQQRGVKIDVDPVLRKSIDFSAAIAAEARDIRDEEARLLAQRTATAHNRFVIAIAVVMSSFALALFLLWLQYRWLSMEVRARENAEQVLADSEKSLRELSLHLFRTQDEERRRIGRDLHDSLGQSLAALKLSLDSLRGDPELDRDRVSEKIGECSELAEEAVQEIRTLSYLLYPPLLEELGLKAAISWYIEGFSQRSGIQTTFEVEPNFSRFSSDIELALFRILQEALTNVHRHSGTGTAKVSLAARNGTAVLEVADQGKGIVSKALRQTGDGWMVAGVGLRGMKERLAQFGGELDISSADRGTLVRATIPVASSQRP